MDTLITLGRMLGFSFAAGVNLYATVAILGLASRFGWVALPPQFKVFDHNLIIGAAIVMYLVEFFADKVPWFDSIWDAIHTVIRPVGGALIAVAALGHASPVVEGLVALGGGAVAASSHLTKAGTRAAVNASPEPFSNWILSLLEDLFVMVFAWVTLAHPLVALAVGIVLLILIAIFARVLVRAVGRAVRARKRPIAGVTVAFIVFGGLLTGGRIHAAPQAGQQPPPPPAQGQQAAQPGQKPTFRTAANYVRVDVYPTSDGRAVPDLKAEDFEVQEDGALQKVETFEHVVVRTATAEVERVEPTSVREANQMATEARARLFVLFLDTYHVNMASAHRMRLPIIKLLDRVIGPDDMVAVMTPEMSPRDITFARKTTTIEGALEPWWTWGRRDYSTLTNLDPEEDKYNQCYPPDPNNATERQRTLSFTAEEMIQRRREKRTLDALLDLVHHLDGIREERKAVVAISDGWLLFRPNRSLAEGRIPQMPGVFVGPDGKLGTGSDPRYGNFSRSECDRDRMMLADIDDERDFRRLLDEANHANVSFYPIDPRGLPVFDSDIGPNPFDSPAADQNRLRGRIESLQTLAENTDGLAIVNSNNIDAGLKRVVDDLTSYYLLGYYSTNAKSDGKFHRITVRVKRPGVAVRARRGYRSPTAEELAGGAAPDSGRAAAAAKAAPAASAIANLGTIRADVPVRFRSGYGWREGAAAAGASAAGVRPEVWVVGELDLAQAREPAWKDGGEATIAVSDAQGKAVATGEAKITPLARSFLVRLPLDGPLGPGEYSVRASLRPSAGGAAQGDTTKLTIPDPAAGKGAPPGQPLLFRRGPFTGITYVATADPRFRRQERIRVELALGGKPDRVSAQLLDRQGQTIDVPVTASLREDATGRAVIADLVLAPLTVGDYVIEVTVAEAGGEQKILTAFKIVP